MMPDFESAARRYTVSPVEAAQMLGLDTETVLRFIRKGKLRASKLSRKTIRIRVVDLDALLEETRL